MTIAGVVGHALRAGGAGGVVVPCRRPMWAQLCHSPMARWRWPSCRFGLLANAPDELQQGLAPGWGRNGQHLQRRRPCRRCCRNLPSPDASAPSSGSYLANLRRWGQVLSEPVTFNAFSMTRRSKWRSEVTSRVAGQRPAGISLLTRHAIANQRTSSPSRLLVASRKGRLPVRRQQRRKAARRSAFLIGAGLRRRSVALGS